MKIVCEVDEDPALVPMQAAVATVGRTPVYSY